MFEQIRRILTNWPFGMFLITWIGWEDFAFRNKCASVGFVYKFVDSVDSDRPFIRWTSTSRKLTLSLEFRSWLLISYHFSWSIHYRMLWSFLFSSEFLSSVQMKKISPIYLNKIRRFSPVFWWYWLIIFYCTIKSAIGVTIAVPSICWYNTLPKRKTFDWRTR